MDCHHVVWLKVGVGHRDEVIDVVLVSVHLVLVDSPDVPRTTVSEREGSGAEGTLVRFNAGVCLPMSPGEDLDLRNNV